MATRVEPDANDAPLGFISFWVDGADPQPGDDVKSLKCDLVVHGAGPGMLRHIVLGSQVPWVLGSWTASVRISMLTIPACKLGVGGG
jgi:hypothetical protein